MRPLAPRIAALSVSLALATGCRHQVITHSPDPTSERAVAQGRVVGYADKKGNHAWIGIPYAEPPVGPLRWRSPVAKRPWEGTFQAVRYGHACVQLANPIGGHVDEKRGQFMGSEDCLTLNVYAPRFAPDAVPAGKDRLPVMVWIHGGGNKIGTGSTYGMARNLAVRHNMVMVTLNYRLGVMGWFRHPGLAGPEASPEDRSGNYGTLDLVRALEWVRDNAAAFGGDPGNVTIFGESAGAINVFSLLSSPPAKGLFHRAIAESGMPFTNRVKAAEDPPEEGGAHGSSGDLLLLRLVRDGRAGDRAQAKAALAAMDGAAVAAYLRSKTAEELIEVLDPGVLGMYESPDLFRDGAVLLAQPLLELITDSSRYNAVPIIVGTNRDEWKFFMSRDPSYVNLWFGVLPRIKDVDGYNRTADYVSSFWKAVGADWPASQLRRAQGANVYAYRFDWDEEPRKLGTDLAVLLGAAHALELTFVFDHDEDPYGIEDDANREGIRSLSKAMSGYWATFARTGAPGRGPDGTLPEWRPWSEESQESDRFLILDTPGGGGLRMSSQVVTLEGLTRRLEQEPFYDGAPRERCRAYARMVRALDRLTSRSGDEDYARFAGGVCQSFPAASLLVAGAKKE